MSICPKFLSEIQDLNTPACQGHHSNDQTVFRLPFEFVIPKSLISARSDVDRDYLNLLPTVKEGLVFQGPTSGKIYMRPHIMYLLKASAVHLGLGKTRRCDQEVTVMPSVAARPPLPIEYFPDEYNAACTRTLKRHIWSRPTGRLIVSLVEPHPLNIAVCEPRATTIASIRLLFEPCKSQTKLVRPYDWDIAVQTSLRSDTFFASRPFPQVPVCGSMKKDNLIQVDTRSKLLDLRSCGTLPWRLHRLTSAGTIIPDQSVIPWTTTLIVPVNAAKNLSPTFLGPLSARRYALVLHLNIANMFHNSLTLSIPIQVINDTSKAGRPLSQAMSWQDQESTLLGDVEGIASMSLADPKNASPKVTEPPAYRRR